MLKSFFQGVGSILNLLPKNDPEIHFNVPECSDAEALKKDWEAVGKDLWNAAGNYRSTLASQEEFVAIRTLRERAERIKK